MKTPCALRLAATAVLVVSLNVGFAATGSARDDGVIGASGKNNGFFCRNCHAGGTAPIVAFGGPTTMGLRSIATFRFTVTSQAASQISAGLDVAASAGVLGLVEGQGTRLQLNEVTHSIPRANDANGQAIFEFTWQAPATAGTYTLFGAGTSANDDTLATGDAAARTTYEIVVGENIPTPTPTPPVPTPTTTAEIPTCVGDCNGDGSVTVDEIITGVNIALGIAPPSACPVFDTNGDRTVTVEEILQAVNNALSGCPRGYPSPAAAHDSGRCGAAAAAPRVAAVLCTP